MMGTDACEDVEATVAGLPDDSHAPMSARELALQSEALRLQRLLKGILDCIDKRCHLCGKCIAFLADAMPQPVKKDPVVTEDDPIRKHRNPPAVPGLAITVDADVHRQAPLIGKTRNGVTHTRSQIAARKRGLDVEEFIRRRTDGTLDK